MLRHEICLISIRFGGVASDKTQRMDFLFYLRPSIVPGAVALGSWPVCLRASNWVLDGGFGGLLWHLV